MEKELKLVSVELRLPPEANLAGALRLFASGLAYRLGFNTDELEDLKLTISEAFLAIIEKSRGARGQVTVKWQETPQEVTIRITDPSHTHTSVASMPVFGVLKRMADAVTYEEGEQPQVRIEFKLPEGEKRLYREDS